MGGKPQHLERKKQLQCELESLKGPALPLLPPTGCPAEGQRAKILPSCPSGQHPLPSHSLPSDLGVGSGRLSQPRPSALGAGGAVGGRARWRWGQRGRLCVRLPLATGLPSGSH